MKILILGATVDCSEVYRKLSIKNNVYVLF